MHLTFIPTPLTHVNYADLIVSDAMHTNFKQIALMVNIIHLEWHTKPTKQSLEGSHHPFWHLTIE